MNQHAREAESQGDVGSTLHTEMMPVGNLAKKLGQMMGLQPDLLVGVAYSERTRYVQITYASEIPTDSIPQRISFYAPEAILSTCRLPSGSVLFEASSTSRNERHLAEIANVVSEQMFQRSGTSQLFFVGLPNVPTRQYMCTPDGELMPLSRRGHAGFTSLRHDKENGFLIGVRLNKDGRGMSLATFHDPANREPTMLFRSDEWMDVEGDNLSLPIASLSALKVRKGITTFIVYYADGTRRMVHLATSRRMRNAIWGNPFHSSGVLIRQIKTETGNVGLCCAPITQGDDILVNTVNVTFQHAKGCPIPDLKEFIS